MSLHISKGVPDFNQSFSARVVRGGDYLQHTWLRLQTPRVQLSVDNPCGTNARLRWTRNLAHNLIYECAFTFDDLVAARFDNYHLDFWAAFTTPEGKQMGYDKMVGNVNDLIQPHDCYTPIPSVILNLPLPFFFSRSSARTAENDNTTARVAQNDSVRGALPVAAIIPFNDMKIHFRFRDWTQLLIVDDCSPVPGVNPSRPATVRDLVEPPSIPMVEVWGMYAIVSNDERHRIMREPHNILIEQAQTERIRVFRPDRVFTCYDMCLRGDVKTIFFAMRNATNAAEWSNYTAASPVPSADYVDYYPPGAVDPVARIIMCYEGTMRINHMSDYLSVMQPWYHAPTIPKMPGYHMYSYPLDIMALDPMGSTNYGQLTNVSVTFDASKGGVIGSEGSGSPDSGQDYPQLFNFVMTCVNHSILHISRGHATFPIL